MVKNQKVVYKNISNELDETHIRKIIKRELLKLNYNFNYIGSSYLVETIYLLYSLKKFYKFSLESEVYPIIAKECNGSANTIKSDIVNATDKMCYDCNEEKLLKYIGKYKMFKPGPKQIVKAVLKRIKDL